MNKATIFAALMITIGSVTSAPSAFAQRPPPPPPGDVSPPPIPPEGRRHVEPMPEHGREAPPSKKARRMPPVHPPLPEPTKPDPVQ